jgi:hypothetical protein
LRLESESATAAATSSDANAELNEPSADIAAQLQRRRFFFVGVSVTVVVTAVLLVRGLIYTDGHLTYVIDDAGIHLAMARNLVEHGTWGVSPGVFEPASSSPGWTLLLAAFTAPLGRAVTVVPLLANMAAGIWVLWIFASRQRMVQLRRGAVGSWTFVLLLPVAGLFLPGLALTGMEHTLQMAFALAAFVLLDDLVDGSRSRRGEAALFLALFAGGCLRLEFVFIGIGAAAAIMIGTQPWMSRRQLAESWTWPARVFVAGGAVVAASTPFLVNGAIDRAFGRGFLPNSIVAKTALRGGNVVPSWDSFLEKLNEDALLGLLVLAAVVYVVFVVGGFRGRHLAYAIAFVICAGLHVAFADIGWWERYQAYLVASGLLLLLLVFQETVAVRWREATLVCLSIAMVLFSVARVSLLGSLPLGMSNTYRQQYQVGRFLEDAYPGHPVAVQDLGYAAFFHDGPVLDLFGLGSHDVLDRLHDGRELDTADLRSLATDHQVEVVAVNADAFGPRVPPEWVAVEEWDLGQSRVSSLFPSVTFYAVDEAGAVVLQRRLARFHSELPPEVIVFDRAQLLERGFKALARPRS